MVKSVPRERPLGFRAYLTAHTAARRVTIGFCERDRQSGGGKRGCVRNLSRKARKRLLDRVHTIRRDAVAPNFVTLTFPDLFPDQATAKVRLQTLFKRWRRRWKKTSALWRMEVIERKSGGSKGQVAPHFHLIVWGEFDAVQASQDWFEVCGSNDYAHLKHGADAQPLKCWQSAVCYVAKYCAKVDPESTSEGRCWGIANRAAFPVDREPVRIGCTLGEATKLRRWIRHRMQSFRGPVPARKISAPLTLFSENPARWITALFPDGWVRFPAIEATRAKGVPHVGWEVNRREEVRKCPSR